MIYENLLNKEPYSYTISNHHRYDAFLSKCQRPMGRNTWNGSTTLIKSSLLPGSASVHHQVSPCSTALHSEEMPAITGPTSRTSLLYIISLYLLSLLPNHYAKLIWESGSMYTWSAVTGCRCWVAAGRWPPSWAESPHAAWFEIYVRGEFGKPRAFFGDKPDII